ncbi:nitrous oxide reductase accessory protein NosL [Cytobacillus sp. Hz8]|uniref:nitrous oxide reductase accessory protein NosL n=1 Tax=Cytobacillus sp. Hz8 TaxID=3347168 RepID=UPI0035E04DE9
MKKNKALLVLLIGILSMYLAACGKDEVKPKAIDEDKDECDICNMAVMDNQFATEIILENGKTYVFDDIGCMYQWMSENKDKKVKAKFVRDYNTKDWVELDKATYVYNPDVNTPMAYNVISFADKKDAESFVTKKKGTILSAKDLDQHEWNMNKDMMKKNSKDSKMDM